MIWTKDTEAQFNNLNSEQLMRIIILIKIDQLKIETDLFKIMMNQVS